MKKLNNKKGFTIVELVIVIAVIGILAGVLIPTFSSVTKSANESAALQEAKSTLENILAVNNGEIASGTKFYICDGTDDNFKIKYTYTYKDNALKIDEENKTIEKADIDVIYLTTTKNVTVTGIRATALVGNAKNLIKAAVGGTTTGEPALVESSQKIKFGSEEDTAATIGLRFSPDIGEKMIVVIPKASTSAPAGE